MSSLPVQIGVRAWLEVAGRFPPEVPLDNQRVTVGRSGADVELSVDSVSRLHAVFERLSAAWVVHDLGSTNGTTLNGIRVVGARVIRDGDVVCLGSAVMTFRSVDAEESSLTAPPPAAPHVTRRERELLVALCRPVLLGEMLTEPAGLRQIADELVISESAVKKLLARTYDAFGLADGRRRRSFLAAEALRRGVITARDA